MTKSKAFCYGLCFNYPQNTHFNLLHFNPKYIIKTYQSLFSPLKFIYHNKRYYNKWYYNKRYHSSHNVKTLYNFIKHNDTSRKQLIKKKKKKNSLYDLTSPSPELINSKNTTIKNEHAFDHNIDIIEKYLPTLDEGHKQPVYATIHEIGQLTEEQLCNKSNSQCDKSKEERKLNVQDNAIISKKNNDTNIDEYIVSSFLKELPNQQCDEQSFLNLLTITELYKQEILKNNYVNNSNLINHIKKHINMIIHNKQYKYLQSCFELIKTYNINDLKLFQNFVYILLKYMPLKKEEAIISVYIIIEYMYNQKIFNKLICTFLIKYFFPTTVINDCISTNFNNYNNSLFKYIQNEYHLKFNFLIFLTYILRTNEREQIHKNIQSIILKYIQLYTQNFIKKINYTLNYKEACYYTNDLIELQNMALQYNTTTTATTTATTATATTATTTTTTTTTT
ncbi:conserved protein, unknown function, partial [Hepatocystis sp. ex Piliocolobus tephrosceles]